jgi:hypothetical protein
MKVLVVDVGGSEVKFLAAGTRHQPRRIERHDPDLP